jgi:hypothetical protein
VEWCGRDAGGSDAKIEIILRDGGVCRNGRVDIRQNADANSAADAGGSCPGADCTLHQAIATAASGDTINFAPAITTINLTSGELLITTNALTINGPGANLLSVKRSAASGTPAFRILNITTLQFLSISDLTIANGSSFGPGGGIYNAGTVTITNSTKSGNPWAASQFLHTAGTLP